MRLPSFVNDRNRREEGLRKKKKEGAGGGSETKSKRAMTGSRGKMAGARIGEQKHRRDANALFFLVAVRCYLNSSWLPFEKGSSLDMILHKSLMASGQGRKKGGVEAIRDRRLSFFSLSLSHFRSCIRAEPKAKPVFVASDKARQTGG